MSNLAEKVAASYLAEKVAASYLKKSFNEEVVRLVREIQAQLYESEEPDLQLLDRLNSILDRYGFDKLKALNMFDSGDGVVLLLKGQELAESGIEYVEEISADFPEVGGMILEIHYPDFDDEIQDVGPVLRPGDTSFEMTIPYSITLNIPYESEYSLSEEEQEEFDVDNELLTIEQDVQAYYGDATVQVQSRDADGVEVLVEREQAYKVGVGKEFIDIFAVKLVVDPDGF